MEQQLKATVAAELAKLGWAVFPLYTAVGSKTYATAVGPKEALAWLKDFGPAEEDVVLTGQYLSEGNNCLSTCWFCIPKTADVALIRNQAEAFVNQADEMVAETYAARLLRH